MVFLVKTFFILSILLFSSNSFAFLNVESLRANSKKGISGALDLSLSGQSGNTERTNYSLSTFNKFSNSKHSLLLIASYAYGESAGERDLNRGHTHIRLTRRSERPVFLEIFNQFQFSEFQRLDLRILNGAGLRYKLIKNERTSFYAGTGVFYEIEELKGLEGVDTFRGNFYLSLVYKPSDRLTFTLTDYYQPILDGLKDFRTQADLGLLNKLTDKLSLGLTVSYSYDSRPPEEVEKTDFLYKVSFNIKY